MTVMVSRCSWSPRLPHGRECEYVNDSDVYLHFGNEQNCFRIELRTLRKVHVAVSLTNMMPNRHDDQRSIPSSIIVMQVLGKSISGASHSDQVKLQSNLLSGTVALAKISHSSVSDMNHCWSRQPEEGVREHPENRGLVILFS